MKRFLKLGVYASLGVALATGLSGCSDDDPDYSDVTPPEVAVSHSISGRVTGMDGSGLSAEVSLNGTSTQTKADGTFVFENVAVGSYTLTASASGKQMKETTVTVAASGSGANAVWNVALPSFNRKDRYFHVKVRPLKEGKWWPAIAVGVQDPGRKVNESYADGEYPVNDYFQNYYVAASKHFLLDRHELGVHLAYRYFTSDFNAKWRGIAGGVTYRPSFARNLR